MKEERDFAVIFHINSHYGDLKKDLDTIGSLEEFSSSFGRRRAILFDFLQIGELLNQLSKAFLKEFGDPDAGKIISIRNRIVHGYQTVRDDIVFDAAKNELPPFIAKLNVFARARYRRCVDSFLGKKVRVTVDRPVGYEHHGTRYELNYGYTEQLTSLDGFFQDAYVLDVGERINSCEGIAVAVIHRFDDIEDKLVVAVGNGVFDPVLIENKVAFIERHFEHTIIMAPHKTNG